MHRVAPKLLEAVMGKEKAREMAREMFAKNTSLMYMGHSKEDADKYNEKNQRAIIEALEMLLQVAKTNTGKHLRLGQLLINAGVAKDDGAFWNYDSHSLKEKVLEFATGTYRVDNS